MTRSAGEFVDEWITPPMLLAMLIEPELLLAESAAFPEPAVTVPELAMAIAPVVDWAIMPCAPEIIVPVLASVTLPVVVDPKIPTALVPIWPLFVTDTLPEPSALARMP